MVGVSHLVWGRAGRKGSRTEAVWKRGGTRPRRGSDIPAVPGGRIAFMPRGGDYPGFGLQGQERRKHFDLRAEAEPPSPSARVTHRGCGWEVDPERGLDQATGLGAGGVESRGEKQAECGEGAPGDAPGWGAEAAGQLACAPRPLPTLPSAPRIPSGLRATGSEATSGRGGRWPGVTNAPPLGVPASQREGAGRSQGASVLVTAGPGSGTALPSLFWARHAGAVGPQQERRGRSGRGGPQPALECAQRSPSLARAGSPAPRFLP